MMGGSGLSAQGGRVKAWWEFRELAGRNTTTTCVERRHHFSFHRTAVYDSRISCLCRYVYVSYIPLLAARGEGRKKDYSYRQQRQTFRKESLVA
jgi:hypothetical protein